ncbi:MAG TPA: 6-phosphogluconolactonase [Chitinophagaceae bacterium]|nr:6-phosphogluconolactonase [Chitinophagaceae bacterium]
MLHIYKTTDETIKGLADYFVQTVNTAIKEKGRCSVVLSGGNSPKKLYELLTTPDYSRQIDWDRIYFFFGDERYVPFTDPGNNGNMVKKALFEPLMIPDANIFYINTAVPPDESAKKYAQRILSHFKNDPVRFDLILLGLGENAHTASLFPHTPVLKEKKALVSAVYIEELSSYRITMTAALINEAHTISFLVYGEAKAKAVQGVLEGEKDFETYPAQLIIPEEGVLHWFLDENAAKNLIRREF